MTQDMQLQRQLLDKHSQLMRMHIRYGHMEQARIQFDILKPLFASLAEQGEVMSYYTADDFEKDTKRFK